MYTSSVIDQLSDGRLSLMETAHGAFIPMLRIPKILQSDINITLSSDPHPAFIANNTPVDEIFIAQFPAPSIARMSPTLNLTLDEARAQAIALGSGFHLMTAWEWSAYLWYMKEHWDQDAGPSEAEGPINNGAGTFFYRTPSEWWGAWGLSGNLYEFCDGLQLRAGKLFGTETNNFQHHNKSDSMDPLLWTELGTLDPFANLTLDQVPSTGSTAQLLLLNNALATNSPKGQGFALDTPNSLVMERGGAYHSGNEAGLGAFRFTQMPNQRQLDSGFRVAYIPGV